MLASSTKDGINHMLCCALVPSAISSSATKQILKKKKGNWNISYSSSLKIEITSHLVVKLSVTWCNSWVLSIKTACQIIFTCQWELLNDTKEYIFGNIIMVIAISYTLLSYHNNLQ